MREPAIFLRIFMTGSDMKIEGIKLLLYAGTIIATIALSWGSLAGKIDLIALQQKVNAKNITTLQDDTGKIKDDQLSMKVDIAVIKNTLQIAQERGQIGVVPQKSLMALAAPTIAGTSAVSTPQPAPQQITYNATFIAPTSQPVATSTPNQSSNQPTSQPIPTPTSQSAICVLNLCL